MNREIHALTVRGNAPNNLLDQRAGLITRLGELVGIRIENKDFNVVDIAVGDTALILGGHVTELKLGLIENGNTYDLGVGPAGNENRSAR